MKLIWTWVVLIEGKVLSRIIVIHLDDNALHQIQSGDIFEAISYRGRLVSVLLCI